MYRKILCVNHNQLAISLKLAPKNKKCKDRHSNGQTNPRTRSPLRGLVIYFPFEIIMFSISSTSIQMPTRDCRCQSNAGAYSEVRAEGGYVRGRAGRDRHRCADGHFGVTPSEWRADQRRHRHKKTNEFLYCSTLDIGVLHNQTHVYYTHKHWYCAFRLDL